MTAPANSAQADPIRGERIARPKRIFWFGAHKILMKTELRRLRGMGFEVFTPPYLSNVDDQSAVVAWDSEQTTTLPRDVFRKLSCYNFFYNSVDEEISELLNAYFDAAIVTILGRWCAELARAFDGPIIFRAYGQTGLLSDDFERLGLKHHLHTRENFHFLPHAQECGALEHEWLQQKMRAVPYALTDDVFDREGTWVGASDGPGYILVSAPNIANVFHGFHYHFLKRHFYQNHYKYLGVQTSQVDDEQVLGTLSLPELVAAFSRASGYLYTYSDPRVCYLPPIEMMTYGGPVIYLGGSLLARYFGGRGPGECRTIEEAYVKSGRLLAGDRAFVSELQAAQIEVVERYRPASVGPIFDAAISDILGPVTTEVIAATRPSVAVQRDPRTVDLLSHEVAREILSKAMQTPRDLAGPSFQSIVERVVADRFDDEPQGAADALIARWRSCSPAESPAKWGAIDILRHPHSNGLIGRWNREEASGSIVREAGIGQSGYLSFGPYIALDAGSYQAHFVFDLDGVADGQAVEVDINSQAEILASDVVNCQTGRSSHVRTLRFSINDRLDSVEFRVRCTGAARVVLREISYETET